MRYEYKVVPAPLRGEKVRGARTTAERFAHALSQAMNAEAREGWEYLRTDTLPCEERSGFTGHKTTYQNMLVFRRPAGAEAEKPLTLSAPAAEPPRRPLVAETEPGAAPKLGPAEGRGLAAE